MDEQNLAILRKKAATVRRDQREYQAAITQERRALATFLDTLRAVVHPCLPMISSPVLKYRTDSGDTAELMGVPLIRGTAGLYLLEDGELAIEEGGSMVHPVSADDVARKWRAAEISKGIDHLREAIDAQLQEYRPRSTRRIQELTERARRISEKLRAVTTLLRDPF